MADDNQGINLDTTQELPKQPVNIDTSDVSPVDPSVATARAQRAHYGLNEKVDKPFEEYQREIATGNEASLRSEVSAHLDFSTNLQLSATINRVANSVQGPLTQDDIAQITTAVTGNKPTDPSAVFETNFAQRYANNVYKIVPSASGSWINEAKTYIPEQLTETTEKTTGYLANLEYTRKRLENAQSAVQGQSYLGRAADFAKGMFQPYVESKLRGNVPDVSFWHGLLGTNLEDQAVQLLRMPFPEFKQNFDRIMDKLTNDNPGLAVEFASAVMGQSTQEYSLNNIFTVAMTPDLATGIKLGAKVVKSIRLYNQAQRLGKDIARSVVNAGSTRPIPVAAADGAGNLTEAGIQQTTSNMSREMAGTLDAEQQAIQAWTSNFNPATANIRGQNAGRFGQEVTNRLEGYLAASRDRVSSMIQTVMRVNRSPASVSTESTIRAVWDEIKTNWKGSDNTILDIGYKFRYHQPSNTYHYDFALGHPDGSLFDTYESALKNAELNGYTIRARPEDVDIKAEVDQHPNYTSYRKSLRDRRVSDKNLPVKNSIDFHKIKTNPLNTEGYSIEQQGAGFYIKYTKPLKETDDIWRDALINTPQARLPEVGLLKSLLSGIRTPEEVLSEEENIQRKIAAHAPNTLLAAAKDVLIPQQSLPYKFRKDFKRLLKAGQNRPDPVTGIPGYDFQTPAQVEEWYLANIKRMPDISEIEAYWSWKGAKEYDAVLRDMAEVRNRFRAGAENVSLNVFKRNSETERVNSPAFDAIQQHTFPGGSNESYVVMGLFEGNEKIYRTSGRGMAGQSVRKKLEDQIAKGEKKVYRVYDPESRPLQGFGNVGDQRIRFVITDSIKVKPVSYNQINRVGGGHLVPDYEFYIKQAKIRMDKVKDAISHWYEGDTTVMPMLVGRMGRDVVKHMNVVREMIKKGSLDEARDYNNANLPFKWEDHLGWYQPQYNPKAGKKVPYLNLDEPLTMVGKNQSTLSVDPSIREKYRKFKMPDGSEEDTWQDGTRYGSDRRSNQVEFAGERDVRDLHTIKDYGGQDNPLYRWEPAEWVDPISVMQRSLNRIIQSTMMDDMKIYSVEHWLENAFKDGLFDPNIVDKADMRANPFWHFFHGIENLNKSAPLELQNQYKTAHRMIRDFVGTPSAVNVALHRASQKLVDSIYGVSPKSAQSKLVQDYMLPYVKDPLAYLRTMTYHLKMGLFALPQFFTQFMTHSNIFAISPQHAPAGSAAMLLHSWATINRNPEILNHLDTLASRMGWRPGEWLEANRLLSTNGFGAVGTEHALRDTPLNNHIITNGFNKFLHAGETPFIYGADSVRLSAYYTAYREFRHVGLSEGTGFLGKPTQGRFVGHVGPLSRQDKEAILARAALLDHNMSRASSSILHTGIAAPAFQFQAYSMRLAELMTGKRLTWQEKARLMGVSSLLYGIPAGSLGLYFFPSGDYIRRKAEQSNYVVGDNYFSSFLMEGFPAVVHAFVTGGGDIQKGTWVDYSKWGTKGVDPLGELMDSNKTFMDIFGGASGGVLFDLWKSSSNFRAAMGSMIQGDGKAFPVKMQDMVDMSRVIRSVNSTLTAYDAVKFGAWMSRNRTKLSDALSPANAIFMAVTGTHPTKVQDIYLTRQSDTERRAYQNVVRNLFVTNFQRGVDAATSDPPDQGNANDFFTRASTLMERYPTELRAELLHEAIQGRYTSLVDKVNWRYWLKDVAPQDKPSSIDIYSKILKGQQ